MSLSNWETAIEKCNVNKEGKELLFGEFFLWIQFIPLNSPFRKILILPILQMGKLTQITCPVSNS